MVFTVLGAVAELERSLIAERVRAGLRNAKAPSSFRCGGFIERSLSTYGCARVRLGAVNTHVKSAGTVLKDCNLRFCGLCGDFSAIGYTAGSDLNRVRLCHIWNKAGLTTIEPEYKGFDLVGRQHFTNRIWSYWSNRRRLPSGSDSEYVGVDAFDPYAERGEIRNFEMRGADRGDDLRECVDTLALLIKFLTKAREARCNHPLEHSRRCNHASKEQIAPVSEPGRHARESTMLVEVGLFEKPYVAPACKPLILSGRKERFLLFQKQMIYEQRRAICCGYSQRATTPAYTARADARAARWSFAR